MPAETGGVENQLRIENIENKELTDSIIATGTAHAVVPARLVEFFARQQSSCERRRESVLLLHGQQSNLYWGGVPAVGALDLRTISGEQARRLALVDANPIVNTRNTEKIWRVSKDGRLFDPEQLKEPTSREAIAG